MREKRPSSSAGRERTAQLREQRQRQERSARLMAVTNVADVDALIEMLHVRRAIEPEAARLMQLTREETDRDAQEFASDHERISYALQTRGAKMAEGEMRTHIDKLLARATKYKKIITDDVDGPLGKDRELADLHNSDDEKPLSI